MSTKIVCIVVGVALFLVGLAKAGYRQSGGFSLRNFGIAIFGTNTQTNSVGSIAPDAEPKTKPDWVGFGTAVVGLLTALIGGLKG